MKYLYLLLLTFSIISCSQKEPPNPTNLSNISEEDDPNYKANKEEYERLLYYADEGTDVNFLKKNNYKKYHSKNFTNSKNSRNSFEYFANGQLEAKWHERGPNNEAGDIREIEYIKETNEIYVVSTEGHIWKGSLAGNDWVLINDKIRFNTDVLGVVRIGNKNRIIASNNQLDKKNLIYSDDDGISWSNCSGFQFSDPQGNPSEIITTHDDEIYYLVYIWNTNIFRFGFELYYSNDKGINFSRVLRTGNPSYNSKDVDMLLLPDTDTLFVVDNKKQKINKVINGTLLPAFSYDTLSSIPKGDILVTGKRTTKGLEFYYLQNESKVYKSTNFKTWKNIGTVPENVWRKVFMTNPNKNELYAGAMQIQINKNDGKNWKEKYDYWWKYYDPDSKDSMHVDCMHMEYFEDTNKTPFIIALNHAGVFITYDDFRTTKNLGMKSLNVTTLYDQSTSYDGYVYAGAQDKGNMLYRGDANQFTDTFATSNISTGDGMLSVFINQDKSIYAMVQNGYLMCFPERDIRQQKSYSIPGTQLPGWINPMIPTPDFNDNKAYVAGGNINGGSGSYLIEMDVELNGQNVDWKPTQFDYNFSTNAHNGGSVIKAIGTNYIDDNRIYVATQDASFFYTLDKGDTWTRGNKSLPSTLLPWDIISSTTDPDKVFVCGTGWSNSGVYFSLNNGKSFIALDDSIPSATFYEIALSNDEQYMYAATSEGPFVYSFAHERWFDLIGSKTPNVDFNSVDIIRDDLVRFGTFGRGIWDLEVNQIPFASVETNNLESEILVFPNPIKTGQSIQIRGLFDVYQVYDIHGKQLLKGSQNTIPTKELAKGSYLVRIIKSDKSISRKVIIE